MVRHWKYGEKKYKYELRTISLEEALDIVNNVPERRTQQRDKAIISLTMIFGKRSVEILDVKKGDVWIDGEFMYIRFKVRKKVKRRKFCKHCSKVVPLKGIMCPYCGARDFTISTPGEPFVERVKHKPLSHPLVQVFLDWYEKVPEDAFLFPPLNTYQTGSAFTGTAKYTWDKHISYVRMWMIFKETSGISPHGARHSLATKLAESGEYDELDLLFWFDWESFDTARKYIKRGGGKRVRKVAQFRG